MTNVIEKQGYKYTEEFGYIPEDWELNDLEYACIDMLQGVNTAIDIPEYVSSGIPMLKANNIIGGKLKINEADNISLDTYVKYSERFKIKQFDFLFSNIGARLGTGSLMTKNIDCSFAWNVMRIIPNYARISPKYLAIFMNSDLLYNQIKQTESGSGMGFIPKNILKKLNIVLPPIPEQEKIAEVLGDVDSLIDKTQQLINKKKDLKTATMQKLLPPKEDWVKSILGEYVRVQGGYSFNSEKFINNGIPIIRISNIYNDDVFIDSETVFYKPINISKEFIINKGDVLIAMSGATTGKVGMYRYKNQAYQNQRVGKFVAINKDTVMGYIKQFLKSHQFIKELNKSIAQGAQPNISSKQIEEIELVTPSRIEQEKIATILSDMDSEIEALEKELNKYKDLKIGVMQQLLTGKVRLI